MVILLNQHTTDDEIGGVCQHVWLRGIKVLTPLEGYTKERALRNPALGPLMEALFPVPHQPPRYPETPADTAQRRPTTARADGRTWHSSTAGFILMEASLRFKKEAPRGGVWLGPEPLREPLRSDT